MPAALEPPSSSAAPALDGVFGALSDAHHSAGFDAGYRRAVNDMLADLALLAAEVGRERPEGRDALRLLRSRFEQHADGQIVDRPAATDGFVSGGLGI